MALLSNIFGCFSSQPKRYICDGDVCVLRNPKQNAIVNKSSKYKRKQSVGISMSLLSMKKS
uniref:Uncharacterized protein n=1 Tax=Cannabis sativa TaxID=3483 RepID=A0A803R801_CANSA